MLYLPVGTMVSVLRTRLVEQICVVECSDPLIIRPANAWERLRYWYRIHRTKAGELAAGAEAVAAIERAKERA